MNTWEIKTTIEGGILSTWSGVKDQIISDQIISDILNVNQNQLTSIQMKYNQKDEEIRNLWRQEEFYTVNLDAIQESNNTWANIHSNFKIITDLIKDMQLAEETITVEKIQDRMEAYYTQMEAELYGSL